MWLQLPLKAQEAKWRKAIEYQEYGAYYKAIDLFKDIANDKDNINVSNARERLATCYRLTQQTDLAEYWYGQISGTENTTPSNLFYYGMMLKANGKFSEAKAAFEKYISIAPHDTRGKRQLKACENAPFYLKDTGLYKVNITNVNSKKADFAPNFYLNGIVFSSENLAQGRKLFVRREQPFLDIFYAEQTGNSPALFGNPTAIPGEANSQLHEATACFTSDYTQVFYTKNNIADGNKIYAADAKVPTIHLQIYQAKRDAKGRWLQSEILPFNSREYSCGHPSINGDGTILYFVSNMPGGYGGTDIYKVELKGDTWGRPQNLGETINTEGNEMFPFVSQDNKLYFASDALPGLGGLDIFVAQQLSNNTWSSPENLRYPINTNADDFSFIFNDTLGVGYMSSNRPGGLGDDDIYCVVRNSNSFCQLKGKVMDEKTQKPLRNAMVRLISMGISKETFSDKNGAFSFELTNQADYSVYATKEYYLTELRQFTTLDRECSDEDEQQIAITVKMNKLEVDPATGTLINPIIITDGGNSSHPDFPLPDIDKIYYQLDQYEVPTVAQPELNKVIAFMQNNPGVSVQIRSHTDSRGTAEYNQLLSEKRAEKVMEYLVINGVSRGRLTAEGMGENELINNCADGVNCSELKHQQNRRTEFVIIGYVPR